MTHDFNMHTSSRYIKYLSLGYTDMTSRYGETVHKKSAQSTRLLVSLCLPWLIGCSSHRVLSVLLRWISNIFTIIVSRAYVSLIFSSLEEASRLLIQNARSKKRSKIVNSEQVGSNSRCFSSLKDGTR